MLRREDILATTAKRDPKCYQTKQILESVAVFLVAQSKKEQCVQAKNSERLFYVTHVEANIVDLK